MINLELLLDFHNGDIQVYKVQQEDADFYHIFIEGYIGFEKLEDFISFYKGFLEELKSYLQKNNLDALSEKAQKWRVVYRTRDVEICRHHNLYWVFLEPYKSDSILGIYRYLEDVINQLINFTKELNSKVIRYIKE